MSLAEQIKNLETARDQKVKQMNDIVEKSTKEGRTLDENETAIFDELNADIESIESDIKRFKSLESRMVKTATPVAGTSDADASQSRTGIRVGVVTPSLEKGVMFGRFVKNFAMSKGNLLQAERLAENEANRTGDNRVLNLTKAAVAAGSTKDPAWIGVLAPEEKTIITDFIEFLRPKTILGQFGQNGIPSLRRVPFNTTLAGQISGGKAQWVGEGKGKPLTKWGYNSSSLHPLKVAAIAVLTDEALRNGSVAIDMLVRDELAASLQETLDMDFINPSLAGQEGVSPASITNGAKEIASSGNDAAAVEADLRALWIPYITANLDPANAVYMMSALNAMYLNGLKDPLGNKVYPDIRINGGFINGVPVIVSQFVGKIVALVHASDIYLGDEDGILIDMSNEASLEMDDAPTQDGIAGKGSQLVSLWQTNMVGIRAERIINWKRRRESAVSYIKEANWGAPAGDAGK